MSGRPIRLLALALLTASGCQRGAGTVAPPAGVTTTSAAAISGEGESRLVGTVPSCVEPPTRPVTDEAQRLPEGLTLPEGALVVEERNEPTVRTLIVQTRGTVAERHAAYRVQLQAAGYTVLREDDEGHEAELYFTPRGGGVGVVQQVRARCPAGTVRTVISTSVTGGP